MNLPDNYGYTSKDDEIPTVIIYAQNIKLFNTDKIQITVKTISVSPFSNRNKFITDNGKYKQVQDINTSNMMQIDVYSRNNEARNRYAEVVMALNSVYSQQQQEKYNFKIGTIPQVNNISGIDGGSDINRYSITFTALVHEQKITEIDYYDKFRVTAETEHGVFADTKINY